MMKFSILLLVSSLMIACQKDSEKIFYESVEENKRAANLSDWQNSEKTPERIFEGLRVDYKDASSSDLAEKSQKICQTFFEMSAEDLSLFESEIRNPENEKLVSHCLEQSLQKLENYFLEQRLELAVATSPLGVQGSQNKFKFPDNVQYRDMSRGYKAISGDVQRKEVVLTFDDGPSSLYTPSIVKSLDEVNAKGIFFALGRNVRANPEVLKEVAKSGHAVASHTSTHPCLAPTTSCMRNNGSMYTQAKAEAEIRAGHQAIFDVLGFVEPMFRFPYGASSTGLSQFLRENGIGEFFWSIDTEDWRVQSNRDLLNKTMQRIDAAGRGVVLFHDIQRRTAEIMPEFLSQLYYKGYSVVLILPKDTQARYNPKIVRKQVP